MYEESSILGEAIGGDNFSFGGGIPPLKRAIPPPRTHTGGKRGE